MSNLVEHAKRELALLGETDQEFVDSIVNGLVAFAEFGHSGGSAEVAISIINDLLQFKPLSPLTNNPAEWNEVGEGVWQSSRNSEAFSTDGGVSYYLVSEMTPYYESEQYQPGKPNVYEEPDPVPQAPVNPGDTVLPVEVVSDQTKPEGQ